MKPLFTFRLLRIITNVAFFASLIVLPIVFGVQLYNYSGPDGTVRVPATLTRMLQGDLDTPPRATTNRQPVELVKSSTITVERDSGLFAIPVTLGVFTYAVLIIIPLLLCYFLFLLKRIFDGITADTPFHPKNSRRIFLMGVMIIAIAVFEFGVQILIGQYLNAHYTYGDANQSLDMELTEYGSVFFGLILIAISQVHRRGVELSQENQLTI